MSYTEELTPRYGKIKDRIQDPGTVYTFMMPNIYSGQRHHDTYTMTAASDKVAIMVLLMITGAHNLFVITNHGTLKVPVGLQEDYMESLNALFGKGEGEYLKYMRENMLRLIDALYSVRLGDELARAGIEETLQSMNWGYQEKAVYLHKWYHKRPHGSTNYMSKAFQIAEELEARRDELKSFGYEWES